NRFPRYRPGDSTRCRRPRSRAAICLPAPAEETRRLCPVFHLETRVETRSSGPPPEIKSVEQQDHWPRDREQDRTRAAGCTLRCLLLKGFATTNPESVAANQSHRGPRFRKEC